MKYLHSAPSSFPNATDADVMSAQSDPTIGSFSQVSEALAEYLSSAPAPGDHQQRVLSGLLEEKRAEEWHRSLASDPRSMARVNSCRREHSSGWLLPKPFEDYIEGWLSPAEFRTASRFRLGLPIASSATTCRLCLKKPADPNGDHSLMCLAGGERVRVHNDIRDCVFRIASMALMNPLKEDCCFGNTSLRSDITLTTMRHRDFAAATASDRPRELRRNVAIDIAVTHFATRSGTSAAAKEPGGAANAYAKTKIAKYAAIAETSRVEIAPIVIDTMGAINDAGLSILRLIAMRWGGRFDIKPCRSIPIVMQRVNSVIVRGICKLLMINALACESPSLIPPPNEDETTATDRRVPDAPDAPTATSSQRGRARSAANRRSQAPPAAPIAAAAAVMPSDAGGTAAE